MSTLMPNPRLHHLLLFLLSGAAAFFLAAAISDYAYYKTFQVQWVNFAAWLLFGGTLYSGLALLIALIETVMTKRRGRVILVNLLFLAVLMLVGIFNSFVHARDAFGAMPLGLGLTWALAILSLFAAWCGFHSFRWSALS